MATTTTTNITGPNLAGGGSTGGAASTANNESITASGSNDTLLGGAGSDTLIGTGANDVFDGAGNSYGGNLSYNGGNDYYSASGVAAAANGGDDFFASHGTIGATSVYVSDTILGSLGNDAINVSGGIYTSPTAHDSYLIYADAGNDTIIGGAGFESIYGGSGDDSISVGSGSGDFISGDNGNDSIFAASGSNDTLYGGNGDDTLASNGTNDQLYGQAGNDTITVLGAGSSVFGGMGNDTITASNAPGGNLFISGDNGNDTVDLHLSNASSTNDTVYGGNGDDTIYGSTGTGDQLYGQIGNDTITLSGAAGTIFGGQGNDLLSDGGFGSSYISGDAGADSIFATGASDSLFGGDGNDSILATGSGLDSISGGNGDDQITLMGNGAANTIYGNAGNDTIVITSTPSGGNTQGGTTTDTVYGGQGNDSITVTFTSHQYTAPAATGAATTMYSPFTGTGQSSNATPLANTIVDSGNGSHFLSGDLGSDTLSGGAGNDTFVGGAGSDLLISHRYAANSPDPGALGFQAASGADTFIFHANDSIYAAPVAGYTGSDINNPSGGEAGLDHIQHFFLNISGQTETYTGGTMTAGFVEGQAGDSIYFGAASTGVPVATISSTPGSLTPGAVAPTGSGTFTSYTATPPAGPTVAGGPTLDTNVFYGEAHLGTGTTTVTNTEQADYAAAYTYAFGDGTTANPSHFAAAVDYIVVQVDYATSVNGGASTGNVFIFDHNGNGVALDGVVGGSITDSQNPNGGAVNTTNVSQTTVNIYH